MTPDDQIKLTWAQGESHEYGEMICIHDSTVYCAHDNSNIIHSFSVLQNRWTELPQCRYLGFGVAVINGDLTTIGGFIGRKLSFHDKTNVLLSLVPGKSHKMTWKEVLPAMPTRRARPAVVVTHTYLVVAGGFYKTEVEILDSETRHWSIAQSLPSPAFRPTMTFCNGYLYYSSHSTLLYCSLEELLKTCNMYYPHNDVWTTVADLPMKTDSHGLVKLQDHLLAIGGENQEGPTAAIHIYDRATNSWSEIGHIPAPLSNVRAAALPNNEVIVMGREGIVYFGWVPQKRTREEHIYF